MKSLAEPDIYKEAMKRVVVKFYRRAPYHSSEGFKQHILEFERKRRNPKTPEKAAIIFEVLRNISRSAQDKGNLFDVILRYDELTGQWGGWETPPKRESIGLPRNTKRGEQSIDSHRFNFGKITARSKNALLDEIMSLGNVDLDRALQIWETGRHGKDRVFRYDKNTNTWRGCFAPKPDESDFVESEPTLKQEVYRNAYGKMPWLNHHWKHPEESDALKWIMKKDSVSLEEAVRIMNRLRNCSKDKDKIPVRLRTFEGKAQAGGIDYVEPFTLTADQIKTIENMAGCWADKLESRIAEVLNIKSDRVKPAIVEIDRLGLTVRFEHKKREAVGGKKWNEERLAQEAEKKANEAKAKADKEDEEAAKIAERERQTIELAATKHAQIRKDEQDKVAREAEEQARNQKRIAEAEALRPLAEQFVNDLEYGQDVSKADAMEIVRLKFPGQDVKAILSAAKMLDLVEWFPEYDEPFYRRINPDADFIDRIDGKYCRLYKGISIKLPDDSLLTV